MGKALEWLGEAGCRAVCGDLVNVDSHKSTGDRLWASCPFHGPEKSPSFKYDPAADKFFCFGCRVSGDLIDLYEKLNGISEGDGFMAFRERYAPNGKLDLSNGPRTPRPSGPPPWSPSPVKRSARGLERQGRFLRSAQL